MLNRPNREAVEPIVVVLRIDTTTVEVQVPTIRSGVERRGPVVAIRAAVVPRRAIAVAGAREESLSVTTLYDCQNGFLRKRSSIFDFSRHWKVWKDV